jgi:hypothetical protein
MRKLRIFLAEIVAVPIILGWLFFRYPETFDTTVPWIALGVLWHLTWELVLDPLKIRAANVLKRAGRMTWIYAFLAGGLISLLYLYAIKSTVATLAKHHAMVETSEKPSPQNPGPIPLAPSSKPEPPNSTILTPGKDRLNLMFKDSPLLTLKRRQVITKDMNGFAAYLKQLGISIPNDIPPIGVDTVNPKATGWSLNSQGDSKYYYNNFTLQQGMLDDRQKVTEAFCNFVIGRFIYKPLPTIPNLDKITPQEFWDATHTPEQMDHSYRWMASVTLTQYLNHSYWGLPFAENQQPVCPDQGTGLAGEYFWRIRKHLGKDFTDKLAAFTVRAVVDKPYTDSNQHYKQYFHERLKMADSVIDNENSKMPAIDAILKDCGWLQD